MHHTKCRFGNKSDLAVCGFREVHDGDRGQLDRNRKAASGSLCDSCSLYETYQSFLERSLEYSGFLKQEEDIPGQISIEMLENGRYMPREEK